MKSQRIPTKITLEAYAALHRAITELKALGLKSFPTAGVVIGGFDLTEKTTGQFKPGGPQRCPKSGEPRCRAFRYT
jgi:hypothetical protein